MVCAQGGYAELCQDSCCRIRWRSAFAAGYVGGGSGGGSTLGIESWVCSGSSDDMGGLALAPGHPCRVSRRLATGTYLGTRDMFIRALTAATSSPGREGLSMTGASGYLSGSLPRVAGTEQARHPSTDKLVSDRQAVPANDQMLQHGYVEGAVDSEPPLAPMLTCLVRA
jgi:hypothetical protein